MLVRAKLLLRILACAALLVGAPRVAHAQTAADSAGVLLGVAERLKAEGRTQLSRSILDLILERYGSTPAAARAAQLRDQLRADVSDQSGRSELMVWGTTYGLWLGVAVPAALDANGPEPYGVGLIVGGPAGFLASRAYARSRPLSVGQARAITFGGTWGTLQGLGWAQVFEFGNTFECPAGVQCTDVEGDPSTRAVMASMLVGGLSGIVVGTVLSQKNITAGTATTVNFGGLWGSWFGGALAAASDASGDNVLASTLIGGNLGIIASAIGQKSWQLSRPRARLISISGLAGALAGAGVLLITQPESDRAILVPAATSALGLGLGAYWTRNYQETGSSGAETRRWGNLETPTIAPRIAERVRNGRLERVPVLGLTLLQARF